MGMLIRGVLPAVILAAGGFAFWTLSDAPEEDRRPPSEDEPVRSRVVTLETTDYPVVVKTNGVVQAHNETALSAQVSGQVVG